MKCLLLTNLMFGWTGSETIITEIAEYLVGDGHDVTILASQIDAGFVEPLQQLGITVVADTAEMRLDLFDFCYCQHQMVNLVVESCLNKQHQSFPFMCYAHLSPYEKLEFPGPMVELKLADRILANSEETVGKLRELDIPEALISVFPNPAPDGFFQERGRSGQLRKILVVSNHLPEELDIALNALSNTGIKIARVGIQFGQSRIAPTDIASSDAVITIGKTVQYALAAKCPVFCYDRFGGPGWLDQDNFKRSAWFNFSGRPERNRLTPAALRDAIVEGYADACRFARGVDARGAGFSLSNHMQRLLQDASDAVHDKKRLERLNRLFNSDESCGIIRREAAIYQVLQQEKKHSHNLANDLRILTEAKSVSKKIKLPFRWR